MISLVRRARERKRREKREKEKERERYMKGWGHAAATEEVHPQDCASTFMCPRVCVSMCLNERNWGRVLACVCLRVCVCVCSVQWPISTALCNNLSKKPLYPGSLSTLVGCKKGECESAERTCVLVDALHLCMQVQHVKWLCVLVCVALCVCVCQVRFQ